MNGRHYFLKGEKAQGWVTLVPHNESLRTKDGPSVAYCEHEHDRKSDYLRSPGWQIEGQMF